MVNFDFKDRYDINDLLKIMELLRSPGGCPWDAEQTHESIRNSFIEETYEVIEAINKKDKVLLQEELGDVLLQVVFHAEMEKEKGSFDFSDVCDGICKKLVERHPHVFGSVNVENTDDVLRNWDDIKRKSKGQKTQGSAMEKIPREMPALMRGEKIQSKARKAGFDWDEIDGAFEALESEIRELKQAMKSGEKKEIEDFSPETTIVPKDGALLPASFIRYSSSAAICISVTPSRIKLSTSKKAFSAIR